jgi:molybdopterin-guanine dinucleotide biosynthesis adapter protein
LTSIFVVSGPSDSGKTTLIERLIPELTRRGLRVAAAKHDPHAHVSADQPGKDSWRLAQAGAEVVDILGPARRVSFAQIHDEQGLLSALSQEAATCEIVLVEGFKTGDLPRLEVVPHSHQPRLEPGTLALVADHLQNSDLPVFGRDAARSIADFLIQQVRASSPALVVLAGGASLRMGRDKATIELASGETMLQTVLRTCRQLDGRVIVASRHSLHERIAHEVGAEFVRDDGPQHPASGLVAGLRALDGEPGIVALACDSPAVQLSVLRRLAAASDQSADFACFSVNGWLRPLPGYFSRATVDPLSHIAESGRPLYELAAEVPTLILSEYQARRLDRDLRSFTSLNVPADVEALAARATREAAPQKAC